MGCLCVKGAEAAGLPLDGSPGEHATKDSSDTGRGIEENVFSTTGASDGGPAIALCECSGPESLRAGESHSDGPSSSWEQVSAWAWGSGNAFGESRPVATPVQLPMKGRSLRGLGTAWEQTLLVANSGALWAAGVNGDHCLFKERPEGPQHAGKVDFLELEGHQVEAAAGGRAHMLTILEDGERLLSWGQSNEFGQLGHGPSAALARVGPKAVALPAPRVQVRQVACGESHSLVLTVAGSIFAFGDGSHGALGLGSTASTSQPTLVDTGQIRAIPLRAIAAGAQHSLALTLSGDVLAWGCSRDGRLGLGPDFGDVVASPTRVPNLPEPARLIAAGGQHSAVILQSNACLLTGDNHHGQLGRSPTQVEGSGVFLDLAGSWHAVALGNSHSLLLGHDGHVYACGKGDQGQLGTGDVAELPSHALKLVRLPPGLAILGLATGPEHGLVLASPSPRMSSPCKGSPTCRLGKSAPESALLQAPVQQVIQASEVDASGAVANSDGLIPTTAQTRECQGMSTVWPGVCRTAKFGGLDVPALRALAQATGPDGSIAAEEEVHRILGNLLANPTLMNASFCFPGLDQLRLDADGLMAAFDALWGSGRVSEKLDAQLRAAAMQGLERWAGEPRIWRETPPPLVHKDQLRGLAVLLMCPLVADPGSKPEVYVLMARLVSLLAALPAEGRRAFAAMMVEELRGVLRSVFVLRIRRFCNAAVRRSVSEKTFSSSVWEGLLVLDTLAYANSSIQQRLQVELPLDLGQGAPVARHSAASNSSRPQLSRGASNIATALASSPPAPVPAEDFELEVLAEGVVPPDVEFTLFLQNSHAKVLDAVEIMEMRPHDPRLHSFTAHRQLLPAAFVRRVLHVENHYRQNLQQQQGFQDMLLAALAGQLQIGRDGGVANVDQSKFFFPVNVRRDHLLEDTLQVLQDAAPADLQKQMKVTFRGEQGQDAGGVSREFFRLLGGELFALQSLLFDQAVAEEARVLWFDRASPRESVDFWMLGVVLGLAVYNSLPGLDVHFPVCVFRKLRGEVIGLEDLGEVYPTVAGSMRALLAWRPAGDLLSPEAASDAFTSTFALDFTVSYEEAGKPRTEDLKPEGKGIQVTPENRAEFVKVYCEWALVDSIAKQFEPFKKGFNRVCASPLLHALTGAELARIVMGESDMELEHLRPRAKYEGFSEDSEYIRWFWEVLRGFDAMHRRMFLLFVTGSDRSPVGGLGELQLVIQRQPSETRRLPSAHTCFNTLMLPDYKSQQQLQEALISAIANTEGFGLE